LEARTIPGMFRSVGLDVAVTRHLDHRTGDDVVAIHTLYYIVDLLAVQTRGAGAGFEMDG
jgi:hypothetical protein